ncbi:MAG: sigma 54-interacting transcriptional regulator [Bacteroidales bacterium]|nr:sigma 54-interacting transcriptional regulator [Bacteroidales bacterium]
MDDKKISQIEEIVLEASKNKKNVLISGEVGSGKEYTARLIHKLSSVKDNQFIIVNITTISYIEKIIPYFRKACGGTIYLDGIDSLCFEEQEKLFEILDNRKIESEICCGQKDIDVKIISSSKKDLLIEIINGRFSKELYHILSQVVIELPALREMGEEIIELAEIFILNYCKENRKPIKQLSLAAKEVLLNYDYPQNHRELKAIIELTLISSNSSIIYLEDIYLRKNISNIDILKDERTLEEYENMIIDHFLKKYDNRVYYVADKLGISKNKIYNMIKKGMIKNEGA